MTEVIFQDVIVKTDLITINYQVKVPKRMQDRVYLVVDQVVVASFNAASFPDNYKEALLQVGGQLKFQKYANLKAMESGYSNSDDNWMFEDFPAYMEITNDYLAKEI